MSWEKVEKAFENGTGTRLDKDEVDELVTEVRAFLADVRRGAGRGFSDPPATPATIPKPKAPPTRQRTAIERARAQMAWNSDPGI